VRCITEEVNRKAKRCKTVRDENGVQTSVLVGKQDERKSKVSEDLKKKLEKMHFYSQHNMKASIYNRER